MSGPAIEALIIIAAQRGVPFMLNLLEQLLNHADKDDPTVQEIASLRHKLEISFDDLIGPIPGWPMTTTT